MREIGELLTPENVDAMADQLEGWRGCGTHGCPDWCVAAMTGHHVAAGFPRCRRIEDAGSGASSGSVHCAIVSGARVHGRREKRSHNEGGISGTTIHGIKVRLIKLRERS